MFKETSPEKEKRTKVKTKADNFQENLDEANSALDKVIAFTKKGLDKTVEKVKKEAIARALTDPENKGYGAEVYSDRRREQGVARNVADKEVLELTEKLQGDSERLMRVIHKNKYRADLDVGMKAMDLLEKIDGDFDDFYFDLLSSEQVDYRIKERAIRSIKNISKYEKKITEAIRSKKLLRLEEGKLAENIQDRELRKNILMTIEGLPNDPEYKGNKEYAASEFQEAKNVLSSAI